MAKADGCPDRVNQVLQGSRMETLEKAEKVVTGLLNQTHDRCGYLMNDWEWPPDFPESELQ